MPDRIVNLIRLRIRPIVRAISSASVGFRVRIGVSVQNDFALLKRISGNPYNEAEDLIQ